MAMSEEQRKAIGENLRKAREKKAEMLAAQKAAAAAGEPIPEEEETTTPVEPTQDLTTNIKTDDLKAILDRLAQLERIAGGQFAPQQNRAVIGAAGSLIGTHEKFITDPKYYPNPVERLAKEPKLRQFAFDMQYELTWNVSTTTYKTADGVSTKEPKFTLELAKVIMGEDGEPTTGRYLLRTAVFHEDPDAAIAIAREQGLDIDETNEKAFLDEMRYLRMKAWLLEAFYPPKNTGKAAKKDVVVGNRIVQFYEASNTEAQGVPFSDLSGKF